MKAKIKNITPGMVLRGNVNGATMEVLRIEELTARHGGPLAVLKDQMTGRTFTHGLEALKRCDLSIIGRMTYQQRKESARQEAIEWQRETSEFSLSYDELAAAQDHFQRLGRRFGLLREFRENAII